jgi:cysteine desulfurase/selenocysteine lyase
MTLVAPAIYPIQEIREAFPGLHQEVRGRPLVYLDNAATAQVPQVVLDALQGFHGQNRANIHRAVHELGQRATEAYDSVRTQVAHFIGAPSERNIIFTRGTTEAINLVANSWGRSTLSSGDNIVLSEMEHHANIVPWQMVCNDIGVEIRVLPVNDQGELEVSQLSSLLDARTKLVSIAHISNALGTINPVKDIIDQAHQKGIRVLIDGAQAVPHTTLDMVALDADFYAFSGHKMYGPTGVGVLYGKAELLEKMPPWQGGGDMIDTVRFTGTTYAEYPHKFEAGTPDIAGVVGLGAAIQYLNFIGLPAIQSWETKLIEKTHALLDGVPGLRPIGTAKNKTGVFSFVVEGVHAHDIGTLLDMEGIAVRTGHHCTQPLMERFQVSSTVRASYAMYNTMDEVIFFAEALKRILSMFRE